MEAKELRIGNLVKWDDESENIVKVVGIYEHQDYENEIWVNYVWNGVVYAAQFDEFEPIPLTEEWLLKFGFNCKYKSCHNHWNIGSFGIEQASDEDDFGNKIEQQQDFSYGYSYLPELEFVHQLQNLYFALTGEELTLKEKV